MAYVLSTPTKRSAVAITQMAFMVVVPAVLVAVACADTSFAAGFCVLGAIAAVFYAAGAVVFCKKDLPL